MLAVEAELTGVAVGLINRAGAALCVTGCALTVVPEALSCCGTVPMPLAVELLLPLDVLGLINCVWATLCVTGCALTVLPEVFSCCGTVPILGVELLLVVEAVLLLCCPTIPIG